MANTQKGEKSEHWREPIPGQYIVMELKADGQCFVYDPLHDDEYALLRRKIEKQDWGLPPQREAVTGIDRDTALYWMQRLVDSGHAKVVIGEIPKDIGEPRRSFIIKQSPTDRDRLADAIELQTQVMTKLLEALTK